MVEDVKKHVAGSQEKCRAAVCATKQTCRDKRRKVWNGMVRKLKDCAAVKRIKLPWKRRENIVLTEGLGQHSMLKPVAESAKYTTGPSRLVEIGDGIQTLIALLPDTDLVETIQDVILQDRELEVLEGQAQEEREKHTHALQSLDRQLRCLEESPKIHDDSGAQGSRVSEVHKEVHDLRKQKEMLERQRVSADRSLETKQVMHRSDVHLLLANLDKILVSKGILQPKEAEDGGKEYLCPSSCNSSASRPRDRDEQPAKTSEVSLEAEEADQTEEKETLRYNYRSARMRLHAMEMALDTRSERFDREADERKRKVEVGELVEPQFDFDMHQLGLTQHYTREVIDAEAECEEAKAAALAGGVELSDVESGFADRPEDGYRLSSEEELKNLVDSPAIKCWVETLPDPLISSLRSCFAQGVSPHDFETAEGVEVDDWDAKSIEIYDSASLVAEGPWRRRIDKWREICGLE